MSGPSRASFARIGPFSDMKIIRSESFAAVRHGWVALALFAAVVAIFGGSSRFDAIQLAALRPLAALFLIPAIYFFARDRVADFRTPLVLLLLLAGWMAIQLVPLPPGIWQSKPRRFNMATSFSSRRRYLVRI